MDNGGHYSKNGVEKEDQEKRAGEPTTRLRNKKVCNQPKERWLNERFEEIERLVHIDKKTVYNRIEELIRRPRNKSGTVIKKTDEKVAVGNLLFRNQPTYR